MREVALLDPLRDPRWLRFVCSTPGASAFHHPGWLSLVRSTYHYPLAAPCVLEGDQVVAGLPVARVTSRLTGRRLVSLPFSDACGPIVRYDDGEARTELLRAVSALRQREGLPLEVRAAVEDLPGGRVVPRFLQHTLEIPAEPGAIERTVVRSSVRRAIAKARRTGLRAERRIDRDGLEAFYALHLRSRRRQGVPIQPKRFILGLAALFAEGLGATVVVREGERPVAAAVFLAFNGVLTYKYGASDERHLAARPNHLLFTEAIEWGRTRGLHTLDLGRTSPDNGGLAAFKRTWGAQERVLAYTWAGEEREDRGEGGASRVLTAVLRRSPTALTRAAGELLYRHVG